MGSSVVNCGNYKGFDINNLMVIIVKEVDEAIWNVKFIGRCLWMIHYWVNSLLGDVLVIFTVYEPYLKLREECS